nr:hypothetical protein [uncultured Roseovarius sp.]
MSAPDRIWADYPDCPYYWADGEIDDCFPDYEALGVKYIRADLATSEADALRAEVERLREACANERATLQAWFDRRKLAHEKVDEAVLNAARGYLRTSRNGGMGQEESDMVEGVIEDMARLSVFADLFARAALSEPGR